MGRRCKHEYRKGGDTSVHCLAIPGDYDYCGHQYYCPNTQRREVNCAAQCTNKEKPAVKKAPKKLSLI